MWGLCASLLSVLTVATGARVPMEEIVSGGVQKDQIPPLPGPGKRLIFDRIAHSPFSDDDLVIGVSRNGRAKAYPLK